MDTNNTAFDAGTSTSNQEARTKTNQNQISTETGLEVGSEEEGPEVASDIDGPSKANIMSNIITISVGFLFNFTAYGGIANVQSSLNSSEGLGTASLSVIYASLVVSCMFVPAALINRIGCKWTMTIAMLMYSTYIAANFYPTWWTLIPTSILLGLAAAPLWSAKCTYLTESGYHYADIVGETAEVIIVRFFGIFFMIFQTSQIWGNLISSLILNNEKNSYAANANICGAHYCNEELTEESCVNGNSTVTSDVYEMHLLCGTYLGCSLFGVLLIALLVNPLTRFRPSVNTLPGLKLMVATFRHMKNPKQLLLIPLTIYSGVEQAFLTSDFTKAFVNCSLGIEYVGFVMMCFGTVDAIGSFAFGPLVKIVGRPPLYIFGALLNLALFITMLKWHPDSSKPVIFYVIAGLYGLADSIWQTQLNSFYGLLFYDNVEAAFANYRLWESIGFTVAYAWNMFLCINVKLYIITVNLCIGMIGYICVEIMIRKNLDKVITVSTVSKTVN